MRDLIGRKVTTKMKSGWQKLEVVDRYFLEVLCNSGRNRPVLQLRKSGRTGALSPSLYFFLSPTLFPANPNLYSVFAHPLKRIFKGRVLPCSWTRSIRCAQRLISQERTLARGPDACMQSTSGSSVPLWNRSFACRYRTANGRAARLQRLHSRNHSACQSNPAFLTVRIRPQPPLYGHPNPKNSVQEET